MLCKKCNSKRTHKAGSYRARGIRVQRLLCRDCGATFSKRTNSKYYRKKKQQFSRRIVELYCEGMSQRAISRVLKLNVKTVERYFLENAHRAQEAHEKALRLQKLQSSYIQADEFETFEHTHKRPLGIQLAIRAKTGEILSFRVARIPMRNQTASKKAKQEYAKLNTRQQKHAEMLLDLEKVFRQGKQVLEADGRYLKRTSLEKNYPQIEYRSNPRRGQMWRLNQVCLMFRQHVSRLRRQTLATTKKLENLEKHLALFVAYQNGYNVF